MVALLVLVLLPMVLPVVPVAVLAPELPVALHVLVLLPVHGGHQPAAAWAGPLWEEPQTWFAEHAGMLC